MFDMFGMCVSMLCLHYLFDVICGFIERTNSFSRDSCGTPITPTSIDNELAIPRTISLNELVSSDVGDIA